MNKVRIASGQGLEKISEYLAKVNKSDLAYTVVFGTIMAICLARAVSLILPSYTKGLKRRREERRNCIALLDFRDTSLESSENCERSCCQLER
jgi:hypothetical protein